jgi:hypothetical protein
MQSLRTYAARAGPGGHWLDGNLFAFNHKHLATLTGDMIGNGTADDPAAND